MPPLLIALLGLIPGILDRVLPGDSPEILKQRLDLQAAMQDAIAKVDLAQIGVNAAEASAPNRTWKTWREQLGTICVWAIGVYWFIGLVVVPLAPFVIGKSIIPPSIDVAPLVGILMTMLGAHYVDSAYNSPPGVMPDPTQKNSPNKGHMQDGVWVQD